MDEAGTIIAALTRVLGDLGIEGVTPSLEHPGDLSHGDYSSSVALAAAKSAKKNPKALADEVVEKLGAIPGVEKITVAGPGFINFYLTRKFFSDSVTDIAAVGKEWGKNGALKGKKVMVEYTSPNLFKPLHVGNLMSNITGESIARLFEWSGAEVRRFNYPSDIGLTVAKAVWGIRKTGADPDDIHALGAAYAKGAGAYEDDPVAKREIEEINKKLYDKEDNELDLLYQKGRATSLRHLMAICKTLGTEKFDFEFFESQSSSLGLETVLQHVDDGIFEKSEGAIIFRGEQHGLHTEVFVNSQGLPTYGAKDIGVITYKRQLFPFDISIIETGAEQQQYFKVVFKASEAIYPDLAGKQKHIGHGFLTLTTGKMSSRKGNVLTGEAILDLLRQAAIEKMSDRDLGDQRESVADAVAVAALKFSILKQGTGKNIIFDPEQSLSFEGDSGPYLQYSHTRALSVLAKARAEKIQPSGAMVPEKVTDLERVLYRFPEVVMRATAEHEPHFVTTYLTELASMFNSWYANEKIVDPADPHSPYKVALTEAFAVTMKNGLWLLGIKAPEKM